MLDSNLGDDIESVLELQIFHDIFSLLLQPVLQTNPSIVEESDSPEVVSLLQIRRFAHLDLLSVQHSRRNNNTKVKLKQKA